MQEKVCLAMTGYSAALSQLVANLSQQSLGRRGSGRSRGFFLVEAVDLLHDHEQGEGDNQKVDDRVDEDAIGDDGVLRLFRRRQCEGGGWLGQINEVVREIEPTHDV